MYAPAVELQRKLSLQCTALCGDAGSDICVIFALNPNANLADEANPVPVPVLCSVEEIAHY